MKHGLDLTGAYQFERAAALAGLASAFAALRSSTEVEDFLTDLCTPAEIEAMSDRWRVVAPLLEGRPYRDIHDATGVSVTTIGRVARCVELGSGGYRNAAARLAHPNAPRRR